MSPDSRELADYEEYCRRELPRHFRAALKQIVHNEAQPLEESIRNQLTNIIRDCQERVFLRYRSAESGHATESKNLSLSHSRNVPVTTPSKPMSKPSGHMNTGAALSIGRASLSFLQPTPPQDFLRSRLDITGPSNDISSATECRDQSDSGYSSNDRLEFGSILPPFLTIPLPTLNQTFPLCQLSSMPKRL